MSCGPTEAEVIAERAVRTSHAILDAAGIPPDALALHLAMRDRDRMRTLEALEVFQRAQFRENY